ncbi:hypothetical protein ACFV0T_09225 [Streptomyces sp. NPDC059582]|uniref:hypothetical protein n=1 Tax=Streptomyces sp. NPDC059582 TaxID=3346875 RepID=UPI00368C3F4F
MVAAFGIHQHFQALEQMLLERHPELAGRVYFNSAGPQMYLRVKLSGDQGTGLALVRLGHTFVWLVVDPVLGSEPSVWPLNTTPNEVLVDAVHAHASAHLASVPVASPWRWHESEPSDMTELADLLVERGVHVRRVAAGNTYFTYGPRHELKLHIADRREGAYVEAEFPGAFVRVSIKPSVGWLADMHCPEWGAWRRVDLSYCLWGRELPTPGVPRADVTVSQVADLIGDGPKAWVKSSAPWKPPKTSCASAEPQSDVQESIFRMDATEPDSALRLPGPGELAEVVLEQLTAFGFGDVREGGSDSPIHSDAYHIEWSDRTKTLSTSEIQRLNGLAAAAGDDVPKRLILISSGGISRPAAAFADKARAFTYHLDPATGRLFPMNSRAAELLPPGTEPDRYYQEPW